MYIYKFVKINLSKGLPPKKPKEDYHKIIEEYAKDGWKLVQIFAPVVDAGPFAAFFDIIFEKNN